MGLLTVSELRVICDRGINEGLALNREKLFFGIAPAIKSIVRDEESSGADGFKIEADRLNQYGERTSDGFLLAIWLTNCADALVGKQGAQQFFRDWAAKVDGLTPAKTLELEDAGTIIRGARIEAARDDQVSLALDQLEAYVGSLSRRATTLMMSKRLHDALHSIQVNVLPLWRRGINNMSNAPDLWRPIVQDRQRQLRVEIQGMRGEASILPPDDSLRPMAQETVTELLAAIDKADAALGAKDVSGLTDALFAIRDVVKDDMRSYATKIEVNQEALDLGILVQNLTRLADHASDAALVDSARKAASALAAILQDLQLIGPQHRLWQDLDVQLWVLEEQFGFLGVGPAAFANFNYQWNKVVGAIDRLAGQPPAEWSESVNRLRAEFIGVCPVPVVDLPSAASAEKFDDFVLEVRRVFQSIDQRMKDTCNLLREIAVELAKKI